MTFALLKKRKIEIIFSMRNQNKPYVIRVIGYIVMNRHSCSLEISKGSLRKNKKKKLMERINIKDKYARMLLLHIIVINESWPIIYYYDINIIIVFTTSFLLLNQQYLPFVMHLQ